MKKLFLAWLFFLLFFVTSPQNAYAQYCSAADCTGGTWSACVDHDQYRNGTCPGSEPCTVHQTCDILTNNSCNCDGRVGYYDYTGVTCDINSECTGELGPNGSGIPCYYCQTALCTVGQTYWQDCNNAPGETCIYRTCGADQQYGECVNNCCDANQGAACGNIANACGEQDTGTIQCNGTCQDALGNTIDTTATEPERTFPGGLTYGDLCDSAANSCGEIDSSGTIQCDGSCSSTTPANPGLCTVYSSSNVCGQTASDTGLDCPAAYGGCQAVAPAAPANPGLCTLTSGTNACGQTASDTDWDCPVGAPTSGCQAVAPAAPADPGLCTLTSGANACGQTASDTDFDCPVGAPISGCQASTPSTPANPGTCTLCSGSNACGETNCDTDWDCPVGAPTSGCQAVAPAAPADPGLCTLTSGANACGDTASDTDWNCPVGAPISGCQAVTPAAPYCIYGYVYEEKNTPINTSMGGPDTGYTGGAALDLTGTATDATTSDGTGYYAFHNLGAGAYDVSLTNPDPLIYTPSSATLVPVNLGPDNNTNFGLAKYYTVSGTIYLDVDNSGTYNAGDTAFTDSSQTITLTNSGTGGTQTASSSIVNGTYTVNNVTNGNYSASIPTPSGYKAVIPFSTTSPFQVNNANVANVNFLVQGYAISGRVYEDKNVPLNGVWNLGVDSAISGATVKLSGGYTAKPDQTTNASGNYLFTGLKGGVIAYTITLDPVPVGYQIYSTNPLSQTLGPDKTDADFPLFKYYTISGNIYNDKDDDGVYDSGTDTAFNQANATLNLSGGKIDSTTTATGAYTFSQITNNTYSVALTTPAGYEGTVSFSTTSPFNVNNANVTGVDFLVQGYRIEGNVIIDYNHNGALDATEDAVYPDQPGATITLSGAAAGSTTTDASGDFAFMDLAGDPINGISYTVTIPDIPSGYAASPDSSKPITIYSSDKTVNFFITPKYSISGSVFSDDDKNTSKGGTESDYSTTASELEIHSGSDPACGAGTLLTSIWTNGVTTTGTGAYDTGVNLLSGTYTICYTNMSSSYNLTFPINGPPPSLQVTVGKAGTSYACSIGSSPDASCYPAVVSPFSGSVQNLNFGITNSIPWSQCIGGDCRKPDGYSVVIPDPAASCEQLAAIKGSQNTPGIISAGEGSYSFCAAGLTCRDRVSDPQQWVMGGTYKDSFNPVNAGVIRTSYSFFNTTIQQAGLTSSVTDLSTICTLSDCNLPAGLANGIYKVDTGTPTTVSLNAYTFTGNKNYVFLINGDLQIQGNIKVDNGSTATFSVSGDIRVSSSVGEASYSSSTSNVEGFYSTDKSFILEGNNDCTVGADKRFNIAGGVVVNAALGSGSFQNNRDLCAGNLECPVYTFTERPDFIVNAPRFIKRPNYTWQEVAP